MNIVLAPSRLQFLHFRCISKQVLKEKKNYNYCLACRRRTQK
uniref:Uncharacterized protein n=1 Tax=Anguilla anguilla TaxID=7936 RepID=A0A0E9S2I0_ANGAN